MRWEFRPCFENTLFPIARPRPFFAPRSEIIIELRLYEFSSCACAFSSEP